MSGWSDDKHNQVPTGAVGVGDEDGGGAPGRASLGVGGDGVVLPLDSLPVQSPAAPSRESRLLAWGRLRTTTIVSIRPAPA